MKPEHLSSAEWTAAKKKAGELLDAAQTLPEELRVEIAEILLVTLPESYRDEVEATWIAEIDRRLEGIQDGTIKLIPGEEAMRMARERLVEIGREQREKDRRADWQR
ncbi:MAG: putative addiction module component [Phycisphaerales bacterium]|nr:putative addiction module component [Phycisphaerales bacterium]